VRHVRRLLKGVGLLVGVALLVGWVRSFSISDEFQYAWSDPQGKSVGACSVAVARGRLLVEWHRVDSEDPAGIVDLPAWSHWTHARFPPDPLELPDARPQPLARARVQTGRFLGIGWFAQRQSSARPAAPVDEEGPITRPIHGGRVVAVEVWSQRAVLLPWAYLFLPGLLFAALRLARRMRRRHRQAAAAAAAPQSAPAAARRSLPAPSGREIVRSAR